uniref:Uncharacterized protein n=1 Tax=Rhizophora mucronata TaxID=61149 RepID=A0A2P2NXP2_RHIMU
MAFKEVKWCAKGQILKNCFTPSSCIQGKMQVLKASSNQFPLLARM